MTNSTDNKKTKTKGPFRTEAIAPTLIVFALFYAYFYIFFDSHLRKGLEYTATQVHGAEVNIKSVRTSFWRATFSLSGLQVTNKENPNLNLFQIGEIRFGMVWDALLRGKVVVDDASIIDIQALTKRAKPGFILPPPSPGEKNSLVSRVQDQILQQTKAKIKDNFLGDISNVVQGTNVKDQLKDIQADLKAEGKIKELNKELAEKKIAWEKRVKDLPKPQEIQTLEQEFKAIDFKTKNPAELAKNIKRAKEIVDQAQAKVKQVQDTQNDLTKDIQSYSNSAALVEKMIQQDVNDLQKRFQIPGFDAKEFSTQLFMSQIEKHLVSLRKYIAIARKYMPPQKTAEEKAAEKTEAMVPRKRGEGVNVPFPITTGYPLFWLKKAAISSEISESEWSGKVSGELRDISSSPAIVKKPMSLHLTGNFPKQQLSGIDFLANLDHTGAVAKESIKASITSYPLMNQMFSDTAEVKFGVKEAIASSGMEASLVGEKINIQLRNQLSKPTFDLQAKSAPVQQILSSVLTGIKLVTMNANISGSWDNFDIHVDSNLGNELSHGFQKELMGKVGDAQEKLRGFVNGKIGGDKKALDNNLNALSSGPGKSMSERKDALEKLVKNLQDKLKSAQGGGLLKGGAGNILKGFGL